MKKSLCLLAILFATLGNAKDTSYFIYGDAQAMGGLPMTGVGVRTQKGMHGFDCSTNVCFLHLPNSLNIFHAKSLYLIYPRQTGLYFGGGLGILNEPESTKITGSFEGSVGFQWHRQIFVELNAIAPFSGALTPIWPGATVGFGF